MASVFINHRSSRLAASSGGAPPPPPPNNNKRVLPADKSAIWKLSDSDGEGGSEVGDTIVVGQAAGPRVSKPKRKRAAEVVTGEPPSWASGESKHRRNARKILAGASVSYPPGSGCTECVARDMACSFSNGYAKCAGCTGGGLTASRCFIAPTGGASRAVRDATANQRNVRIHVSHPSATEAVAAAAHRQPTAAAHAAPVLGLVTMGTIRRESNWTLSNADIATELAEVEAGANPAALLRMHALALFELREEAWRVANPPTFPTVDSDGGAEEVEAWEAGGGGRGGGGRSCWRGGGRGGGGGGGGGVRQDF